MKRLAAALLALLVAACAPHVQLAGPRNGTSALAHNWVLTQDGVALPLRAWLPDGPPRAAIIALHGFNDYSNSYDEPGKYWASRGIATYAYDQRGFGRTDWRGYWHGGATLAEDLREVVELVRARHPGLPVFVVGESMGGAVAMIAATKRPLPVDGIVLAAPAVWGRKSMNEFERSGLWFFAHVVPWYTVSAKDIPVKFKASDNIEMLKALGRDPMVIKETRVDAVHGLVDLMDDAYAVAGRFDAPALVLYGQKDEIVPPEPTYDVIGALPDLGRRQRIAVYPEGYHMLMRDLQAKVVLEDIAIWIGDRTARLPSGAEHNAVSVLAEKGIAVRPPGAR